MDKIKAIENEQLRENALDLHIGDTVRVHCKIKEGNRERIQIFEGTLIKRQRGGANETFTVRRVAYGTGVERTFPVNSPKVAGVEVVRKGKVRRAKLTYLRSITGTPKIKERRDKDIKKA